MNLKDGEGCKLQLTVGSSQSWLEPVGPLCFVTSTVNYICSLCPFTSNGESPNFPAASRRLMFSPNVPSDMPFERFVNVYTQQITSARWFRKRGVRSGEEKVCLYGGL